VLLTPAAAHSLSSYPVGRLPICKAYETLIALPEVEPEALLGGKG
jgi:hypothetical protein